MKRPSTTPGADAPVILTHAQELVKAARAARAEARRLRDEAKRLQQADTPAPEDRRLPEPWELLEARRHRDES